MAVNYSSLNNKGVKKKRMRRRIYIGTEKGRILRKAKERKKKRGEEN